MGREPSRSHRSPSNCPLAEQPARRPALRRSAATTQSPSGHSDTSRPPSTTRSTMSASAEAVKLRKARLRQSLNFRLLHRTRSAPAVALRSRRAHCWWPWRVASIVTAQMQLSCAPMSVAPQALVIGDLRSARHPPPRLDVQVFVTERRCARCQRRHDRRARPRIADNRLRSRCLSGSGDCCRSLRLVVVTLARLRLRCSPGSVPEWPKGAGCKPVGFAYGGSNPPRPTSDQLSRTGVSARQTPTDSAIACRRRRFVALSPVLCENACRTECCRSS